MLYIPNIKLGRWTKVLYQRTNTAVKAAQYNNGFKNCFSLLRNTNSNSLSENSTFRVCRLKSLRYSSPANFNSSADVLLKLRLGLASEFQPTYFWPTFLCEKFYSSFRNSIALPLLTFSILYECKVNYPCPPWLGESSASILWNSNNSKLLPPWIFW